MKKLILLFIPLLFLGCTKTVYIDSQSGEDITDKMLSSKVVTSDFLNYECLAETRSLMHGNVPSMVYRDIYTDVLYVAWASGNAYTVTPIMNPDGSCLTYEKWKLRKKDRGN